MRCFGRKCVNLHRLWKCGRIESAYLMIGERSNRVFSVDTFILHMCSEHVWQCRAWSVVERKNEYVTTINSIGSFNKVHPRVCSDTMLWGFFMATRKTHVTVLPATWGFLFRDGHYALGMFFRISIRWSHTICTVGMCRRSSGECTPRRVGPNDTMSMLG